MRYNPTGGIFGYIEIWGCEVLVDLVVLKPHQRALKLTLGLVCVGAVLTLSKPSAAKCLNADAIFGVNLPAGCLTSEDGMTVRLRYFRADLTVAALSCKQQTLYNQFVNTHENILVRGGRSLRTLFARLYKKNASAELNKFLTHLTNRASLRRLTARAYCKRMEGVFTFAQSLPSSRLVDYIRSQPVMTALGLITPASDARRLVSARDVLNQPVSAD